MKLNMLIDDSAVVIDDFLPNDLLKQLADYKYIPNRASHSNWNSTLFGLTDSPTKKTKSYSACLNEVFINEGLAEVKIFKGKKEEYFKDDIFKRLFNILQTCPFYPFPKDNYYFLMGMYKYQQHSGINWHDDGESSLNFTLYIHPHWHKNWGGEILIEQKDSHPLAIGSDPNRLVCIKNFVQHKVSLTATPTPRHTIQCRLKLINPNIITDEMIREDVRAWSKDILEPINKTLKKPRCPYAGQAWRDNKVRIEIRKKDKPYQEQLDEHLKNLDFAKTDILLFCDPYSKYSEDKAVETAGLYNEKYNKDNIYFLGHHPNVHGNSTLRYSMILVQNFTDLVKASDKLEKTGFYTHFKADFYSHTVKRRKEIYNKFFKKN